MPNFRSYYPSIALAFGQSTDSGDYYNLGVNSSIGDAAGEKLAYYLRYDFRFGEQSSISLKYLHEDWFYIDSAKESWGLEYNSAFDFVQNTWGFYYSIGIFYRWLKQSWNDNPHSIFNYDTEDQSAFLSLLFGWRKIDNERHWGFEMHNRDAFSYYNTNHVNFEVYYTFLSTYDAISIYTNMKTTGLMVGAPNMSEWTIGIKWQNL